MMVGLLSMKLVHSPIKEDFICMDKNSSTVAICLRQLSGQILAKWGARKKKEKKNVSPNPHFYNFPWSLEH